MHTWVYLHLIEQFLGRDCRIAFLSTLCMDQEERQYLPRPIVEYQLSLP